MSARDGAGEFIQRVGENRNHQVEGSKTVSREVGSTPIRQIVGIEPASRFLFQIDKARNIVEHKPVGQEGQKNPAAQASRPHGQWERSTQEGSGENLGTGWSKGH